MVYVTLVFIFLTDKQPLSCFSPTNDVDRKDGVSQVMSPAQLDCDIYKI